MLWFYLRGLHHILGGQVKFFGVSVHSRHDIKYSRKKKRPVARVEMSRAFTDISTLCQTVFLPVLYVVKSCYLQRKIIETMHDTQADEFKLNIKESLSKVI